MEKAAGSFIASAEEPEKKTDTEEAETKSETKRRLKPSERKAAAETNEGALQSRDSIGCCCRGEHFASLYKYDIIKLDSHTFILGLD